MNREERFWTKVDKTETCWLWTGAKFDLGYGMVRINYKLRGAHRVSYEMTVGPIPEGLDLDHLCRVPSCVNPAHLEPVTRAVNVLRGDGPCARNARKTHCIRGHNDWWVRYVNGKRHRRCRECRRIAHQRHYAREQVAS